MEVQVLGTGPLRVNTLVVPLCNNKVFVVDPADCDFSRDSGIVASYLLDKGLEPVAVVLTHGHFDHVSGLPAIREKFPNVPILIHENDSKCIGSDSENVQGYELSLMSFDRFLPYVSKLPSATGFLVHGKTLLDSLSDFSPSFDDELKDSLRNWEVFHTPGHTKGCVCVYNEKKKVLVSGDTLFYHSWGRTDLSGGSEVEIQKSLKMILDKISDDTKIYPGHDYSGFTKNS